MGPALFVMAIMGCGEGHAACAPVREVAARYETEAACLAATPAELARNDDLEFPLVVAQCHRAGVAPRRLSADEVLLPDAPQFTAPARYADARPARRR